MNPAHLEKRHEARRPTTGAVKVRFSNPEPQEIVGRLIDLSTSGFRMAHDCAWLSAGQLVDFSHAASVGQAQVMWNRILAERVETGFLLVGNGKDRTAV